MESKDIKNINELLTNLRCFYHKFNPDWYNFGLPVYGCTYDCEDSRWHQSNVNCHGNLERCKLVVSERQELTKQKKDELMRAEEQIKKLLIKIVNLESTYR